MIHVGLPTTARTRFPRSRFAAPHVDIGDNDGSCSDILLGDPFRPSHCEFLRLDAIAEIHPKPFHLALASPPGDFSSADGEVSARWPEETFGLDRSGEAGLCAVIQAKPISSARRAKQRAEGRGCGLVHG